MDRPLQVLGCATTTNQRADGRHCSPHSLPCDRLEAAGSGLAGSGEPNSVLTALPINMR